MATLANTVHQYGLKNKIPDIHRLVTDASPWRSPLWSKMAHKRAKQEKFTWTEYKKRAAQASNEEEDGTTFAADAETEPFFLENHCQISTQHISVDNRVEVSKTTGKTSMSSRTSEAMIALKYDVESTMLAHQLPRAAASGTSGRTASISAWIRTNISRGTNGTAPTRNTSGLPNGLGTAGTARGFTKSQFDTVLLSTADESDGQPGIAIMRPRLKLGFDKVLMSGATANLAAPRQDYGPKGAPKGVTVQGAVMTYNSTFGSIDIMSDQFALTSASAAAVHILDVEKWCLVFLRKMHYEDMGIAGDYKRRSVRVDWGTMCKTDITSGIIRDININTAVAA